MPQDPDETISVVIAAFNVAAYIERALESAVSQTWPVFEVIVVDDLSTDATRDIVTRFSANHPEVKLIALDANGGPARARNMALDHAQGKWVAVLDADDVWKPDRLEKLFSAVGQQSVDFIADNQVLYDLEAKTVVRVGFEADWLVRPLTVEALFRNDLADRSPLCFGNLKPILRREFLLEHSIRYDERLRYGEDFLLDAEILCAGGAALLVNYPGYVYSLRVGSTSKKASGGSRTVARFDHLVSTSDMIVARHGHSFDQNTFQAINIRRRYFQTVHHSNVARELRRSGKLGAYALYVFRHSDLLFLLIIRTINRALRVRRSMIVDLKPANR